MTRQARHAGCRWVGPIFCLTLGTFALSASSVDAQPVKRLLHNEDETNFFWTRQIPEGQAGDGAIRSC